MNEFPAIQTSEADVSFLKTQLGALLGRRGAPAEIVAQLFDALAGHYSGPGRFYHNLHHVAEMLKLFDSLGVGPPRDEAVRFAAWFHDAVYDTREADNEEQSAELAASWLAQLSAPPEIIDAVRQMILATKRHEAESLSPDAALFLDSDLAILGAPEEVYLQYRAAIRKEYAWVKDAVYRRERRRILENFIARDRLYFTDELRARLEAQARRNLRDEIQALASNGLD
jgi:predicted metal-dependent HD superfamily phosphohydrolase